MRWITSHLELKIVALVLAVAVWSYTRGQSRAEVTVPVLIDPQTMILPAGARQASVDWREFQVVLSVPRAQLHIVPTAIEPDQIYLRRLPVIDGQITVPVTARLLGLDAALRLVRVHPPAAATLTVTLGVTTGPTTGATAAPTP